MKKTILAIIIAIFISGCTIGGGFGIGNGGAGIGIGSGIGF